MTEISSSASPPPPLPLPKPSRPSLSPATGARSDRANVTEESDEQPTVGQTLVGALEQAYQASPPRSEATQAALARIQEFVQAEHQKFGGAEFEESVDQSNNTSVRAVSGGLDEGHEDVYKRVGDYWQSVGLDYDGQDKWAWSAAFLSKAHQEAGVGEQFQSDFNHSTFIRDAIRARSEGDAQAAYWGHRSSERAPQVGDMLAYARESGVDYDNQRLEETSYKSHADVVTGVGDGYLEVIGGNYRDTVAKRRIPTDEDGLVRDQDRYFVVLEPINLEPGPQEF